MTEDMTGSTAGPPEPDEPSADRSEPAATVSTGRPEVDAVLASLDGLADTPLEEHVAVFEAAHERLRAALSDDGRPAGT